MGRKTTQKVPPLVSAAKVTHLRHLGIFKVVFWSPRRLAVFTVPVEAEVFSWFQ